MRYLLVKERGDALDPISEGGEPAAFLLRLRNHFAHLLLSLFKEALFFAEFGEGGGVLRVRHCQLAHALC